MPKLTVKEIHDEYYAQYRGQSSNLPTFSSPEFKVGLQLLRAAIKKWERADGILWRELFTKLSDQDPAETTTLTTADVTAPVNMRKPPAAITFTLTDGRVLEYKVASPELESQLAKSIYFTGGANTGYTLHVGDDLFAELEGATFDYLYYRSATLPSVTVDPSATYIDMSDTSFAVQFMLQQRFMQSRNGFGYKTAQAEAQQALANMKIENYSGVPGNTEEMAADYGWGAPQHGGDIFEGTRG